VCGREGGRYNPHEMSGGHRQEIDEIFDLKLTSILVAAAFAAAPMG
jgi:hypothetical protein